MTNRSFIALACCIKWAQPTHNIIISKLACVKIVCFHYKTIRITYELCSLDSVHSPFALVLLYLFVVAVVTDIHTDRELRVDSQCVYDTNEIHCLACHALEVWQWFCYYYFIIIVIVFPIKYLRGRFYLLNMSHFQYEWRHTNILIILSDGNDISRHQQCSLYV